ncbi:PREDICTED: ZAR1-like protein [Condylura cristata]|uniref:ZAR1-like protein n=1 Tax=Condylura cristata TaxID=143302 RepID=UPI0003344992|nr:PREDICTED: ZAR1-like protein [Condylura cristata]
MERIIRVPYGLYQGYGNTVAFGQAGLSEHKHPDWRQNAGPPTFLARPGLLVPANASDYCMDAYKRAQLKAILSQMNPSLSLRLCKVNTKEMGVQVSPRVDKSVQCSLGPRTLRSHSVWSSTSHKTPLPAWGVYSPSMGHRGLIRQRKDEEDKEKMLSTPTEARQLQLAQTPRLEEDKQEKLKQHDDLGEEDASSSPERKSKQEQVVATHQLGKSNFQFLEPKYGYFHCKDCKTRWESAFVWCISGTNKVYFKQLCCKCQKSFNPYRVEAIQCQTCSKSPCSCPQKKRHIDLRRPHRQELCGRCKDKRFSCGNIYSFKYSKSL